MGVTYYKRYRMEINLRGRMGGVRLPRGYRLVAWNDSLCGAHAVIKCECFRGELDAGIFPCLGEYDGCSELMEEIARRDGRGELWLSPGAVSRMMAYGWPGNVREL